MVNGVADNGGMMPGGGYDDPQTPNDPKKPRPPAFVRQPLGTVATIQPPGPSTEASAAPPPTSAKPAPSPSPTPAPAAAASAVPVGNGGGMLPDNVSAPPAGQNALTGVMQAPGARQQPLDAAAGYSAMESSMGPRPTWETLPDQQKHHGFRKALDYIGSAALGAYTANPMAGMGLYRTLSRAPLQDAQEKFDSQSEQLKGGFDRQMGMAKQQTAEDVASSREAMYQGRLEDDNRKILQYGQKITHYWKDSEGNWKGEQANGQIVDAVPPPDQREPSQTAGEKFDEQVRAREKEADRLGITGEDRKFYVTNGKLKEPGTSIHVPSADASEYEDWKKQFQQDNGRVPSAQEIANYRHPGSQKPGATTFKTTADIDKYSDAWYAKRRQQVRLEKSELRKNQDMDDVEKQREYGEIEKGYSQDAGDFERRKKDYYSAVQGGRAVSVDEQGKPVEGGGAPQAQPVPQGAPQPQKQPQASPAQNQQVKTASGKMVTIGQAVTVKGVAGKITGVRNGKPVFTPDSGEGAARGSL